MAVCTSSPTVPSGLRTSALYRNLINDRVTGDSLVVESLTTCADIGSEGVDAGGQNILRPGGPPEEN